MLDGDLTDGSLRPDVPGARESTGEIIIVPRGYLGSLSLFRQGEEGK